ncbi:MAG: AMP-binding protein [Rhodospirillaceae bacterium]|nr:AMP-binding protein [Rhodospirillaceae bacterium]
MAMDPDTPAGPAAEGGARTIAGLLHAFADLGDRPALVTVGLGQAWSYGDLQDRSRRLAAGLLADGLTPQEPVALLGPSRAEWVALALAVIRAGGTVVPLDTVMAPADLAHALDDCECRRVFASADRLAQLGTVVATGGLTIGLLDADTDGEAGRSWRAWLADAPAPLPTPREGDRAVLFYTSGTTGRPKGVPLTHGNIAFCVHALLEHDIVVPGDRVLVPLPLYHVYPFVVGLLTPLALGITLVFPEGLTGPQIVAALREGEATVMVAVPRLYDALMTAVRGRLKAGGRVPAALFGAALGLSSWLRRRFGWPVGRALFRPFRRRIAPRLRLMVSGGAKLDAELAWSLEGLGWELLSGYGLTETSPIVAFNRPGRADIATVGVPLNGVEIRIDQPDADGNGEILVKGPNVFGGYHHRPEETQAAFTADGWFRTTDLGRVDERGYLRIAGRRSERIVLAGGKNVYPEAVEAAYDGNPLIREIAVLDDNGRLAALVMADAHAARKAGAKDVDEAVRAAVRAGAEPLPPYMRPGDVAVTRQALPRTPLGKLRRHQLPALYRQAMEGRQAPARAELTEADLALLQAPSVAPVWGYLRDRYADRPVHPNADLEGDLGVDSLEWVNLSLALEERAGLVLQQEDLARIQTVRDLLEHVLKAGTGSEAASPASTKWDSWAEPRGPFLRLVGIAIFAVNRVLLKLLVRHRQRGAEHLPATGPAVLTPNHLSFMDAFAVAAGLPRRQVRQTFWAGTTTYLLPNAVMRFFSRAANIVPVEPGQTAGLSIKLARRVLGRGDFLVWFPEGRISLDGQLQSFQPGLSRLVEGTEARFVPIHLKGTGEAWPRDRRFPRAGRVSVLFGHPLTQADLIARGEGESDAERLVDGLRREVLALAQRHDAP